MIFHSGYSHQPIYLNSATIYNMKWTQKAGFTLLELLVVIAIIGILVAILAANFDQARQTSKNKAVGSELTEAQLAIELYKSQNGAYPPTPSVGAPCRTSTASYTYAESTTCSNGYFIDGLTPEFTNSLPESSVSANRDCVFRYTVANDQSWYKLTAVNCFAGATQASEGVSSSDELARCPTTCSAVSHCNPNSSDFYQSMAVYSLGGECRP